MRALRQAAWDHQAALDALLRGGALARSGEPSPDDAPPVGLAATTVRNLWTHVTEVREHARRFLETAGGP